MPGWSGSHPQSPSPCSSFTPFPPSTPAPTSGPIAAARHKIQSFHFHNSLLKALAISLYYDLLPAACSAVSRQQFEEGLVGKGLSRGRSTSPLLTAVRKEVWQELRRLKTPSETFGKICSRYRMYGVRLEGLHHSYLPVSDTFGGSEIFQLWRQLPTFGFDQHHTFNKHPVKKDILLLDSKGTLGEGVVMNRGIGEVELDKEVEQQNEGVVELFFPLEGGFIVRARVGLQDKLDAKVRSVFNCDCSWNGFVFEVSLKDSTWLGENLEEALGRRGLTVGQVLSSCNHCEEAASRKNF